MFLATAEVGAEALLVDEVRSRALSEISADS